ncbi:hypothetical protein BAUCODRAFT_42208, partial [Baudoinia panamericana UAMH 10762]
SPTAPDFSPITPRVQPALPVTSNQHGQVPAPTPSHQTDMPPPTHPASAIAPAEYIHPPPSQPFSSDDSIDGLALKAAIASLQFQKHQAEKDIKGLEATRKHALQQPHAFTEALVAGKVKEVKPQFGGIGAILQAAISAQQEVEDEEDDDDGEEHAAPGAEHNKPPDFSPFPGPQDVIRMPYINWEKYHIAGDALDHMHEQQRRWPGSHFAYGQDRGREFAVAAPYSPFQD